MDFATLHREVQRRIGPIHMSNLQQMVHRLNLRGINVGEMGVERRHYRFYDWTDVERLVTYRRIGAIVGWSKDRDSVLGLDLIGEHTPGTLVLSRGLADLIDGDPPAEMVDLLAPFGVLLLPVHRDCRCERGGGVGAAPSLTSVG